AEQPGTEARADSTREIDRLPVVDALRLLARESRAAFEAFDLAAPGLAPVVDAFVTAVRRGGCVHLFGAGSSGRLAALDAAEIPPTFGVEPSLVRAHIAGGPDAMVAAV